MKNFTDALKKDNVKYASVFQEYRRHFTTRRNIGHNFKNLPDAWEAMLIVIRRVYKIPASKLLFKGAKFDCQKNIMTIERLTQIGLRREIAFETCAIDKSHKKNVVYNRFTTGFALRETMIFKRVKIKYTEHIFAYEELFGLRASLAKFGFRREVSRNKKLFQKELQKELDKSLQAQDHQNQK